MDRHQLRRLLSALRSGIRGIRATPLVFAVSVSSMVAGLLLLGSYLLVVQNMRGVLERFGHELKMVAFLDSDVDANPATVDALRKRFEVLEGVSRVRFVSRDQALQHLRSDLGREAGILDGLEQNPLPASFELELTTQSRSPEALAALAARVGQSLEIQEVRYGEDWVQGYARIVNALMWLGAGLGAFLVLLLGTIVAGTVRLALYARTDEIQIQRLVGAGALFVRLPFYLEGALQGALAALVALCLLYGMFQLGLPILGDLLVFLIGSSAPAFFGAAEIALLFVTGVGLGLGGAMLSLLRLEEVQ